MWNTTDNVRLRGLQRLRGWLTARPFAAAVASSVSVAILAAASAGFAGARLNTTPSTPYGIYWVRDMPFATGNYVTFCPPADRAEFALATARGYLPQGRCAGGTSPMLKKIVAGPGDTVAIDQRGVHVNGRLLSGSRPLRRDAKSRPMPVLNMAGRRLGADEVLLLSDAHAYSFDGRYFGPLPRSSLQHVVVPWFTWRAPSAHSESN